MAATKIPDSQLAAGDAWGDWTPTYQNFVLGNGTVNYAKYKQVGKTVHWTWKVTYGSTTTHTDPVIVSMPVAPSANFNTNIISPTGSGTYSDSSSGGFFFIACVYRTGTPNGIQPIILSTGATNASYSGLGGSVPVAAGTGDVIQISGFYETV